MKKLLFLAITALTMLACGSKNDPATPGEIKDGALPGRFSVSASTRVQFSQGNLRCIARTNRWQFAENQYDFIGSANVYTSTPSSNWIDLFSWGSGDSPMLIGGNFPTFVDWGKNVILNGGNKENQWRTLTMDEWIFLINVRTNAQKLFGLGTVNGVCGAIILPDNWIAPNGIFFCASATIGLNWGSHAYGDSSEDNHFEDNIYTPDEWSKMEQAGAVFLPAAGYYSRKLSGVGSCGYYWTATPNGDNEAYYLCIESKIFGIYSTTHGSYGRRNGRAVRLVQNCR